MNRNQLIKNILAVFLAFCVTAVAYASLTKFVLFDASVINRAISESHYVENIAEEIKTNSAKAITQYNLPENFIADALASFEFSDDVASYINYRLKGINSDVDTQIYANVVKKMLGNLTLVTDVKPNSPNYQEKVNEKTNEIVSQLIKHYVAPFHYSGLANILNSVNEIKKTINIFIISICVLVGGLIFSLFALKKSSLFKYFYRAVVISSFTSIAVGIVSIVYTFKDDNVAFAGLKDSVASYIGTLLIIFGLIVLYFALFPIIKKVLKKLFGKEKKQ